MANCTRRDREARLRLRLPKSSSLVSRLGRRYTSSEAERYLERPSPSSARRGWAARGWPWGLAPLAGVDATPCPAEPRARKREAPRSARAPHATLGWSPSSPSARSSFPPSAWSSRAPATPRRSVATQARKASCAAPSRASPALSSFFLFLLRVSLLAPCFRREGTTSRKRLLKRPTRVNMKQGKRKKKNVRPSRNASRTFSSTREIYSFCPKNHNSPSVRAQVKCPKCVALGYTGPETRPQLGAGGIKGIVYH